MDERVEVVEVVSGALGLIVIPADAGTLAEQAA